MGLLDRLRKGGEKGHAESEGKREEITGRIAHIQLECTHCGKTTDAYILESEAVRVDITCEHCNKVFEFGPGTAYKPIAYVPGIPPGAELAVGKDD